MQKHDIQGTYRQSISRKSPSNVTDWKSQKFAGQGDHHQKIYNKLSFLLNGLCVLWNWPYISYNSNSLQFVTAFASRAFQGCEKKFWEDLFFKELNKFETFEITMRKSQLGTASAISCLSAISFCTIHI